MYYTLILDKRHKWALGLDKTKISTPETMMLTIVVETRLTQDVGMF